MGAQDRADRLADLVDARRFVAFAHGCDHVGREVRGEEEDGVAEIDEPALAVVEDALVEDLVEEVHDVEGRLLHLVEEDDGIGPLTDGFGEQPAFSVPDIARRRADEARDRMLLLELRHVDGRHEPFAAEEEVGDGEARLRFADA